MLADDELMDLQIHALFTHDARSRLVSVNEPGSEAPAPRLFFGRTRRGNVWRYRADLPDGLVAELEALCAEEPVRADLEGLPRHAESFVRLLETHAPVRRRWAGPAFLVPEHCRPSRDLTPISEANAGLLRGGFEELIEELPHAHPFLAAVEGGRAVSVCRSVRVTPAAHEAGVETLPEYRGRGYAADAVAAWARSVRASGAIPVYSTSWENAASRAVAAKLCMPLFGADFHVT